jgi:hypothetical protein
MHGWNVADITFSSIQLFLVSVLTITHKLRNLRRKDQAYFHLLFAIRLALSVALLACTVVYGLEE